MAARSAASSAVASNQAADQCRLLGQAGCSNIVAAHFNSPPGPDRHLPDAETALFGSARLSFGVVAEEFLQQAIGHRKGQWLRGRLKFASWDADSLPTPAISAASLAMASIDPELIQSRWSWLRTLPFLASSLSRGKAGSAVSRTPRMHEISKAARRCPRAVHVAVAGQSSPAG